MTRSELIQKLATENPHLLLKDIEKVVETIFDKITVALCEGGRVELRGFGAFSVKKRDPRVGRNPRSGETVEVESKAVPFFKPGKGLRDRLNTAVQATTTSAKKKQPNASITASEKAA